MPSISPLSREPARDSNHATSRDFLRELPEPGLPMTRSGFPHQSLTRIFYRAQVRQKIVRQRQRGPSLDLKSSARAIIVFLATENRCLRVHAPNHLFKLQRRVPHQGHPACIGKFWKKSVLVSSMGTWDDALCRVLMPRLQREGDRDYGDGTSE